MNQSDPAPELSVVISCLNEERTIAEFLRRLDSTLASLGRSYEIIATDDGSKDQTFSLLVEQMSSISALASVAKLFKNSGQAAGLTAGIERALGRSIVFIDSDLQLEPEQLPQLLEAFDRGADIVTGYRAERRDGLRRRLLSFIANRILQRASGTRVRDFGCTYKIIRGELLRSCRLGPFRLLKMSQVLSLAGRIEEVPVTHLPRPVGRSGWTFPKLLSLLIDNLIGTSVQVFQRIALGAIVVAMLLVLRILVGVLYEGAIMSEVTNGLLLNATFFWGLMTVGLLALVGEFARQIYQVSSGRPGYVVKEVKTRCS